MREGRAITFRLHDDLYRRMAAVARSRGSDVSTVIRELLHATLPVLEAAEQRRLAAIRRALEDYMAPPEAA